MIKATSLNPARLALKVGHFCRRFPVSAGVSTPLRKGRLGTVGLWKDDIGVAHGDKMHGHSWRFVPQILSSPFKRLLTHEAWTTLETAVRLLCVGTTLLPILGSKSTALGLGGGWHSEPRLCGTYSLDVRSQTELSVQSSVSATLGGLSIEV